MKHVLILLFVLFPASAFSAAEPDEKASSVNNAEPYFSNEALDEFIRIGGIGLGVLAGAGAGALIGAGFEAAFAPDMKPALTIAGALGGSMGGAYAGGVCASSFLPVFHHNKKSRRNNHKARR